MPKFVLEQVYRHSKNLEEQDILALAEVKKLHQACINDIDDLNKKIDQSRKKIDVMLRSNKVNIDMLKMHSNYEASQNQEVKKLLEKLDKLNKLVEKQREKLIKSSIKVKTFEILKTKQLLRDNERAKKLEARLLDEIAIQKHKR